MKIKFQKGSLSEQYIHIETIIPVLSDVTILELPAWRPGRYELANFAKFIRNFKVLDENGYQLDFKKIKKDTWKVQTPSNKEIHLSYNFHASILNAGSTFLYDTQLYINPVNCCFYTEETFHQPVEIFINVPSDWQIATSMEQVEPKIFRVENCDELFDSPFIASSRLQHKTYESHGVKFHVWFNGEVKPKWEKLLKDFQAFTNKQIEKFSEFPSKEFHFLFQILTQPAYHGVEHLKSTVIALGPSYSVFEKLYAELLGVSSHELYHAWNVKSIRPQEMLPYDFKQENYSELGYIYEGITTYQGDLFLLKSGVFSEVQYFKELEKQLQRHFDNPARFHYSVAESSFDTWLDGYQRGAPGRKVSIYTEGCLLAFCIDVKILSETNGKYGLDEVIKRLYFNYAIKGKGITENDYKNTLIEVSGFDFSDFFEKYIHGTNPFESILIEAFETLGLELQHTPSPSYSERELGLKTIKEKGVIKVLSVYHGSPAELSGLILKDEIIAVNGCKINSNLDEWLNYFAEDTKDLLINRSGRLLTIRLPEVNRPFYMKYHIKKKENMSKLQNRIFDAWKK